MDNLNKFIILPFESIHCKFKGFPIKVELQSIGSTHDLVALSAKYPGEQIDIHNFVNGSAKVF